MAADAERAPTSIWRGHRVRLRPVEPDDWPLFHAWGQDDAVSRLAHTVPFPESAEAVRRWAEGTATREWRDDDFRWLILALDGDAPVGTINTHGADRRAGTFSYGVALASGAERRGFGSEAVRLVLRYYFLELGYQKANAHVHEFNGPSRLLHERLGFVLEGRLRRMVYTAGRHWDMLAYGMVREEFDASQASHLPPLAMPHPPAAPAP